MKTTSVKKNFAYQLIYQVLVIILPFITSPYISRVIGAEGLGIYSYSYSVAYYFVLFSLLGIANYGNRTIAQVRENQEKLSYVFSSLVVAHILFSVIFCIIYILYVTLLAEDKLYAAIQVFYVLSGLFDISWFYFGIEKFKFTVTRNVIIRIINVICVFAFVHEKGDLWKYCLIMALSTLLSQMVLWIPLKNYISFRKPTWGEMKVHIKPLMILFIPTVAVSLYKYMDKIMIGILSDKIQLGFYENAEKVINIPMTVVSAFGTIMLPKMSNLVVNNDNDLSSRYIKVSMEFIMYLAVGLSFGLAGCARVFAPVFWGNSFSFCGELIRGMSITIPFIAFANVIRTQYLIPKENDREYMVSVIIGAFINLIINCFLIVKYGAYGAMIGTIVAEISVCIIQILFVKRELPIGDYVKSTIFYFPMGLFMFVVVSFLGRVLGTHTYTLLIQVSIGGVLYVGMGICFFYITKNVVFMNNWNRLICTLKRCRHKKNNFNG